MYPSRRRSFSTRRRGSGNEGNVMKDLYFIDAYNVIFWEPAAFPRDDLEASRKKLIDLLLDYGAHNDVEIVAVFDGQGPGGKVAAREIAPFSRKSSRRRR